MKESKVLIVGINGFIGSNLRNYIEKNYPLWRVYGIDRKVKRTPNFFKLDIENQENLKTVLRKIKPRYIFHLAGDSTSEDFKQLLNSNVQNTFILLDAIKKIRKYNPRIVIPSSASEYGKVSYLKMPIEESTSLNPVSPYGFSKVIQTETALMFARQNLDIVIARIFNIIGGNVPRSLAIGKFAYELALISRKKKKNVLCTKNLNTKRDFLDIEDVCRYLTAVACYGRRGEVYNVCRGKSYKIRFLLNKLIDISEIADVKIVESRESNKRSTMADCFGSNKKISRIIKKVKLIPINESLRSTYSYYLSKV